VLSFSIVPCSRNRSLQNRLVKVGSRSEMMELKDVGDEELSHTGY
jgi:hypothetical protein